MGDNFPLLPADFLGPDEDGVVDDQPRIDYLEGHLGVVADAISDGADARGSFDWYADLVRATGETR